MQQVSTQMKLTSETFLSSEENFLKSSDFLVEVQLKMGAIMMELSLLDVANLSLVKYPLIHATPYFAVSLRYRRCGSEDPYQRDPRQMSHHLIRPQRAGHKSGSILQKRVADDRGRDHKSSRQICRLPEP